MLRRMVYRTEEEVIDAVEGRLKSTHPNLLDGFESKHIAEQIIDQVGLPVEEGLIDKEVDNG